MEVNSNFLNSLLQETVNLTPSTFEDTVENNSEEELQKRKAKVEQIMQTKTDENDSLNDCTYT